MAFLLPSHFSSFCQPDGPSSTKNGTTLLGCEMCRLKFTACHVRLRTSSQLDGWASSFSPSHPFHQLRFALPFRLFLNSPDFVPMYKIATGHEIQSIESHGTGNQDDGQLLAAYPFPCGFGFAVPLSSGGGFPIPIIQQVNLLHTLPFNSNQITGTSDLNFLTSTVLFSFNLIPNLIQ
jgi:hypothetical protein